MLTIMLTRLDIMGRADFANANPRPILPMQIRDLFLGSSISSTGAMASGLRLVGQELTVGARVLALA